MIKRILKILSYIIPYWPKAVSNIILNILSVIFGLFSIVMIVQFLGVLFDKQPIVEHLEPFKLTVNSLRNYFYYYIGILIESKGKKQTLLYVSIFMVAATFFKLIFKYISLLIISNIRMNIVKDIRNNVFDKVLSLPLSFFSSEKQGDLIIKMTDDVKEIEMSIVSSLEMIFRDPISIIIYLFSLFYLDYKLTLIVIFLLPGIVFIIGRIGKKLKKESLDSQKKMGYLLSIIEETLSGLRIIKAFNAETKILNRFSHTNDFFKHIMTKIYRKRYLANPLSELIGTIVIVFIMWYGGTLILNHTSRLNPQDFIGYLMLFYLIIVPSQSFSTAYFNVQKGMASVERIESILNADEKIRDTENPLSITQFKSSIAYKNVYFKYDSEYVLNNINIELKKGETIALVGKSGAGKTTVADLLPRFYDIDKGEITIDGISIKNYKISELRNLIGVVNQLPILFNDTFFNNIAFGEVNATEEQVIEAAKIANAHEFIIQYEKGYYTNIGDRGDKLSGGQRQRISIARAILKNPPILILDEATSSLDSESEKLVYEALTKLMKNRTSIVIAHRLSTIKSVDKIYVLNNGQIVESGTHNELLKLNSYYKNLYDLQLFD